MGEDSGRGWRRHRTREKDVAECRGQTALMASVGVTDVNMRSLISRLKHFLSLYSDRPHHHLSSVMQPFTVSHIFMSICCQCLTGLLQVLVEGNIGSGKTSLIDFFAQNYSDRVFPSSEPIHKWRDVRGHNLFNLLAADPAKYAFPFQQYVQLTMAQVHRSVPPVEGQIKLMERSLYSARFCFVENLHSSGLMSDAEFAVYEEYFHFLTRDPEPRIDLIVYLKASPDVCLERALSRKRKEESKLTIDYLVRLDELHDKWLLTPTPGRVVAPVLTIPADASKEVLSQIFESISPFVLGDKRWSGSERLSFLQQDQSYTSGMKSQKLCLPRDENIALN